MMKVLNVILVLIVVLLAAISFHLMSLKITVDHTAESNQLLINAQQALISSNQRLQDELVNLRKQIIELQERVSKTVK
jgi:hypothetical protein